MKAAYVVTGLALVTLGCAADRRTLPPPVQTTATATATATEPARCIPLQTKAQFNCWRSGRDAPLTHCLPYAEDVPACGLKARGGAYLTRGAPGDDAPGAGGGWLILNIYADAQGRVGMAAEALAGTRFLAHHDQSPPPTGRPTEPIWPRWPSELEFGPEQAARP